MGAVEASVSLPTGVKGPDPWKDEYGITLPLDHIISRNREGDPVSRVGDFVWDWTAYDPRGRRSSIYFYYWTNGRAKIDPSEITPEREARVRELQYLTVQLIYRESGKKAGAAYIRSRLNGLFLIARFAESQSCSIQYVLSSRAALDAFIKTVPDSVTFTIVVWLKFLWRLDSDNRLGYHIAKPRRWRNLQTRAEELLKSYKQTAAIPTRIYAQVINALSSELDDIEEHKEQLLAALRAAVAEYDNVRKDNEGALGPAIIARYGLEDYLAHRGISNTLTGLGAAVGEIFRVCKLQIHTFSGMRDAEAQHLSFHCMLTERRTHGRKHALITGVTTKLEGGRRRQTKWVTTERDGFRAIKLAQQFASVIYGSIGVTPSESEKSKDEYPLFISTGYLRWVASRSTPTPGKFAVASASLSSALLLRQRICPMIEEDDIAELEEIEPFREWREEPEYAIGQPWPLKPHQLRRSLALYANASGLVRLSSLRRQLQHITREMSLYYAKGSAFAINFIAEDPEGYRRHVVSDWQGAEQEAQYLAFVQDVLESDEPMYGPAGIYYEMQKKRNEVLPQEEFKKQMKMGRLAYRPSPLGGCTNPDSCQTVKGLRLIDVTCATEGCKHLIGKHSKIIETIRLQRRALVHLDPASITYQIEKEELDALEATEVLWRPMDGDAGNSKGKKFV